MQCCTEKWLGLELVTIRAESRPGPAVEQFSALLDEAEIILGHRQLTLDDAVFTRFWLRDRAIGEPLREVRKRRFDGNRRTASSSFYSTSHIFGAGDVSMDLYAFRAQKPDTRRLVDFNPPRRRKCDWSERNARAAARRRPPRHPVLDSDVERTTVVS